MKPESNDRPHHSPIGGVCETDGVYGEPASEFERAQAERRREHQRSRRRDQSQSAPPFNPDAADRGRSGGRPQYDDYAADAYFNKARQRIFDQHFGPGTAEAVLRLGVRVGFLDLDRESGAIHTVYVGARNEDRGVHDCGDALKARRDTPEEIALMVELAVAKGWTTMHFKGSPEFCALARARAEAVGLTVGRVTETGPNPYAYRAAPATQAGPADAPASSQAPEGAEAAPPAVVANDVAEAVAVHEARHHGMDDLDSALDLEEGEDGVFRSARSGPTL